MDQRNGDKQQGRGAQCRPANRYESVHFEPDPQLSIVTNNIHHACDDEFDNTDSAPRRVTTQFLPDESKSIIAENDSPDVGFRYSVNPYRGCEHGCAYCYARPSHEWLGFDAGVDFESKILVKHRAAELFREALAKPSWAGELIAISGNTDCYQPAERQYRLTRALLAVAFEARQPIVMITKNALILRDLDLLRQMATQQLVHVNISVTTLNAELARSMEPRTSTPRARLDTIMKLTAAGVPVRALVAPVIPGLNDEEIPAILKAVREAGAQAAGYVLLRLPLTVEPVFRDWLSKNYPQKQSRIESLIRSTREGKLNESAFRTRMKGQGSYAEQIATTFRVFSRKYELHGPLTPALDSSHFRHPKPASGQTQLF